MNYTNQKTLTLPSAHGQSQSVLSKMLKRYVPKWPYFILAIIVAIGGAYLFIKLTKPVFEIKASMLVMDKDKSNSDKAALQEIDVSNASKKVEIEIEVLQSRHLIKKVTSFLKLQSKYGLANDSKESDLYKKSPVIFQPVENVPEGGGRFTIKIISPNYFDVTDGNAGTKRVAFNKLFKSEVGLAMIQASPNVNTYIGKSIIISVQDTDALITNYQNMLTASLVDQKASIIELRMNDVNPARGKDFLNYLIAAYNIDNTAAKNKLTQNTLAFIDARLGLLSGELTSVEKNIEGYKSSRGITDISSESNVYLQNIQTNDIRLNEANVQLKIIEGIEQYINTPGNNNVPATIGIEDKGLVSLIEQLSKLQLERNKLLATTPESNYLFEPIKRQIQTTMAAIKENVRNIKSSLLSVKNGLQSVNTKVESSIKDLPGQERGYISIKRQQGIKENLYTYLLQKREEVALSYAATITDASVIDSAYVSSIVWPKKPLTYAVALLAALFITSSVIYLIDLFGNTATSTEEVEEALSTQVLSELTYVKTDHTIVVLDHNDAVIAQQFRALRTNLHYLHGTRAKGRVTMISSSRSGEGKSFATSNLGISLAASGRKTVILDMDLHKPKIGKIFGLQPKHIGISEFLNRKAAVSDILQSSNLVTNLSIISSGAAIVNPSELIENDMFCNLIDNLKMEFDDIIIDTPPLHLVTDAYILSQFSDVSLYIIRKGMTKKSELNFIQKLYNEQRLPKLSLIFNGAPAVQGAGY